MTLLSRLTATFFGAGYSPVAPGTAGAFVAIMIWYGLFGLRPDLTLSSGDLFLQAGLIILYLMVGVWATGNVQKVWGDDPSRVVIDEAVGVWIAVFAFPAHWTTLLAGFILFRVFDIWKPLGIRYFDRLHSAWGVMLDDVLAGVYAWILVALLYYTDWIGSDASKLLQLFQHDGLCRSSLFTNRKIGAVAFSMTIFADMKGGALLKLFAKSQISSMVATAVDYSVFFCLTKFAGVYYVLSAALGAVVGALINFNMNRRWTYRSTDGGMSKQAFRYILVSGMSLLLTTSGIYLITEYAGIAPEFSRIIIGVIVAVGFNFVLHKAFVFK